jgi:hypothetical protein
MTKLEHLFGTYQKTGARISQQGRPHYLLITTRKVTTPKKPPLFLILKGSGEDQYISSLYPVEGYPDTYKIEFKGQIGYVVINGDRVEVLPLCQNNSAQWCQYTITNDI